MSEVQQTIQATGDASFNGAIPGVPLTIQDELWMEMARDSFKNSSNTLNDTLQKLATLTGAMAGGLVILKDSTMGDTWRIFVIVLLLLSLSASVKGMFPKLTPVKLGQHASCREFEKKATAHKAFWLKFAGAVFSLALVVAIVGMIVNLI